ncbi:trypsin-like peptidase domain-containing protein [Akkermansiaceae bacterium]|nr:trypsin-like peptidase domain-containing protein [Akkermansiaceae bacterium]
MSVIPKALALLVAAGLGPASAFPLNSKKAPESQDDLMAIQEALQAALPAAKAATVCIDLGGGSGSGVIVSKDGLVMTAAHVTSGVGKDVKVIMPDGKKLKAETLGLVADTDAALLQITEKPEGGGDFPFVEINRTDDTKLGDWIFSLGHSGGFDKDRGVVVRLARLVRVANTTIQTDGTLIGGDSGGPLFDMEGRLVGIHSRVGPQLPVNMHVPVKVFLDNWDKMLESEFIGEGPFAKQEKKGSGFLGIATKDVEGGLEITKVGKESPAEKAGLKEGDLVRTFNGEKLTTREGMQALLAEMAAEDKLTLEITRDGKDETIELRLGKR